MSIARSERWESGGQASNDELEEVTGMWQTLEAMLAHVL